MNEFVNAVQRAAAAVGATSACIEIARLVQTVRLVVAREIERECRVVKPNHGIELPGCPYLTFDENTGMLACDFIPVGSRTPVASMWINPAAQPPLNLVSSHWTIGGNVAVSSVVALLHATRSVSATVDTPSFRAMMRHIVNVCTISARCNNIRQRQYRRDRRDLPPSVPTPTDGGGGGNIAVDDYAFAFDCISPPDLPPLPPSLFK